MQQIAFNLSDQLFKKQKYMTLLAAYNPNAKVSSNFGNF